jgi:L-2-hydroxyglutarate oxidase LhgO
MAEQLEAVVVGAGAVGLAIGMALARELGNVCVVEQHGQFGFETSSRNSEVLHAGIYYQPGSLKAKLCREGLGSMLALAAKWGVPHAICGKLIVTRGAGGESGLQKIMSLAEANGVTGMRRLSALEAHKLEPEVTCDAALLSAETGIIDSHMLMAAYEHELLAAGGFVAYGNRVSRIIANGSGFDVFVSGDPAPISCRRLVNAGGLHSARVAACIEGLNAAHVPVMRYARGVYFSLQGGRQPFRRLVYPLPDNASLGIHATIDMAGHVRFGPDVEWTDDPQDYHVDAARESAFRESIAGYYPGIASRSLLPAYAGIRPKLVGAGEVPADFRIDLPEQHGIAGLANLHGIESPGLTASLAIARLVAAALC